MIAQLSLAIFIPFNRKVTMKTYTDYKRERQLFESASSAAVGDLTQAHARDEAAARNAINMHTIAR
jgi:hypothetical protein